MSYASYCQDQGIDCARRARLASSPEIAAYCRSLEYCWLRLAKRAQETGGVLCHESGPATLLVRGKPRSMPGGLPETRRRVDRSGRALVAPTKAKEPSRSVNATALNRTF